MTEVAEEKLQPLGRDGRKRVKHKVQSVCGWSVDNILGRERHTVGKLLFLITRTKSIISMALRYRKCGYMTVSVGKITPMQPVEYFSSPQNYIKH